MWHVDHFRSQLTERGRSPLVEEGDAVTEVGEALLVLASVEKGDEADPRGTAQAAAREIEVQAKKLGATVVVLHPFAHLFAELSGPQAAVQVLDSAAALLRQSSFTVHRPPFGWFNALEISAKGHPLSRVARRVVAE